jgi:hypothetical protein
MLNEKLFETGQDLAKRIREQNSLEIAKNLLADGLNPTKVAKNTGLPLAKVKALLKKSKTKQPA